MRMPRRALNDNPGSLEEMVKVARREDEARAGSGVVYLAPEVGPVRTCFEIRPL